MSCSLMCLKGLWCFYVSIGPPQELDTFAILCLHLFHQPKDAGACLNPAGGALPPALQAGYAYTGVMLTPLSQVCSVLTQTKKVHSFM
jgi:hypothetical protein